MAFGGEDMELLNTAQAAVTLVVEDIEKNTLKTAWMKFKIGENVQSILNETNAYALAGATIQVNVVRDEITNITAIELNASGAEGALMTLDGSNTFFLGNMTINADNVELKNLIVIGDITLTSKAATRFVTNKLEVKGEMIVEDVNTSPTTSLFNIPSIPMFELKIVLFTSMITKLEINRSSVCLNSNLPISILELTSNSTHTQFNRYTKIELLIIPHDTNPTSFINNFNNVNKNIGKILTPTGRLVYYQGDCSVKEVGMSISNVPPQALVTIEEAAESYWQETDLAHAETETIEEYYVFMNQTLSLFQTVFEQNAEIAGFNMTSYYNLSENRRKESLFDWLLLWNIMNDDFSEIMNATQCNDRLTPIKKQIPTHLSNTSEDMNAATILYGFEDIVRTNFIH